MHGMMPGSRVFDLTCTLAWPVRQPQDLVHAAVLQAKGLDTAAAAVRVSGLELGGLAGSLSAGKCPAGSTRSMDYPAGCGQW